jgi:hypothetical protein
MQHDSGIVGFVTPKNILLLFYARPCNMTRVVGLVTPKIFKLFYAPAMRHDTGYWAW